MNGKTAKKIKKAVYGDTATKGTTTYAIKNRGFGWFNGKAYKKIQILLTPGSKRAKYQEEKAAYKAFARNGRKVTV